MYTTSNEYKIANLQEHRKFESDITIGTRTLTNDDLISFSIQQSIQQDDTFSIGNTIASCLNLIFLHNDIDTNDKDIVDLKLGLLVNEIYEYIPLGIYNISSIDTNDTTTTLVCYDNMIKFDVPYKENTENPTLYSVITRLVELTGIQFGGTLSSYTNYSLSVLENYSCREVLGFIAGVLGANAIIDRTGKFNFVSIAGKTSQLSIDNDSYYDYTKKNKNYILKKIVNITDTEELSVGTVAENTSTLQLQNPFVNQTILQDLYNKLNNLEFLPYSLNFNGDISLDLGDLISITDKKEVIRVHPILSQTITYTGALNTVLGAQGETKTINETNSSSSEENEIVRVGKKVIQVQKDAGELFIVVYDEENQSSVRLTEKALEAIADEIQLTAQNIKLEGLVTANDNFKINLDGSIEALNGKFSGTINGATIVGGAIRGSSNFFTAPNASSTEGYSFRIYSNGKLYSEALISTNSITDNSFSYMQPDGVIASSCRVSSPVHTTGQDRLWLGCKGAGIDYSKYNVVFGQESDSYVYFRPGNNSEIRLGRPTQMWNTVYAVNGVSSSSDRTLKENIQYLATTENAKATVSEDLTELDLYNFVKDDLVTAKFNFIGDDKEQIGFIAQDLLYNADGSDNKVGQLIVNKPDNEQSPLTYNEKIYTNVLAGALRQAILKIEELEKKINMLEELLI